MTRLNDTKRAMLRTLNMAPRSARHFTNGDCVGMNANQVQKILNEFCADGLCHLNGKMYRISDEGREVLAAQAEMVPAPTRTYGPATTERNYQEKNWRLSIARQSGLDHERHRSLQLGGTT